MKSLIFSLTQAEQPTNDLAAVVDTYTTARIREEQRTETGQRILSLLKSSRTNIGFDAVALMNAASEQGNEIENIMFDFLPWCYEHGALFMVSGSYMDLLIMITEPLAD